MLRIRMKIKNYLDDWGWHNISMNIFEGRGGSGSLHKIILGLVGGPKKLCDIISKQS